MTSTTTARVPKPFTMISHRSSAGAVTSSSTASSSRSSEPSSSAPVPPPPTTTDSTYKGFGRFRETFRTATRSRKPATEDAPTVTARSSKGKEKAVAAEETTKEKEKDKDRTNFMGMIGSKVTFLRGHRDSLTPSSQASSSTKKDSDDLDNVRIAGFTPFTAPSLRQASMSSPTLPIGSVDGLPSSPSSPTKSRPAVPLSSFSPSGADSPVASPSPSSSKNRSRSASLQPAHPQISGPLPLAPRRDHRSTNGHAPHQETVSRHRSTRSTPVAAVPPSPSTTSFQATLRTPQEPPSSSRRHHRDRRDRDLPSPPETPSPMPRTRPSLSRDPPNRPTEGSGVNTASVRNTPSPVVTSTRTRSASRTRVVTPSQRGLVSPSSPQLPLTSHSPTPSASRRPSVDNPRRPSIEAPRRPSVELTRKTTNESATVRRTSGGTPTPHQGRGESSSPSPPLVKPRTTSPAQRPYGQNRHYSVSNTSLVTSVTATTVGATTSNPELRELIRTASSILCKEVGRPPVNNRSENLMKDWEEVDFRMNQLVRLERSWSTSSVVSGGEEREKRAFVDALRDGFVLCYYMNHLRQSTVVRPNSKENGISSTANIAKFLASCSSYGLPDEDLFQMNDLLESTTESLTRVAKTIVALSKFVPSLNERSKILLGAGSKKDAPLPPIPLPPPSTTSSATGSASVSGSSSAATAVPKSSSAYPPSSSRAAASTPNLIRQGSATQLPPLSSSPGSVSPLAISPTSPTTKRRWSPPTPLPTVRSNSSNEGSSAGSNTSSPDRAPRGNDRDDSTDDLVQEIEIVRHRSREVLQMGTPPPSTPNKQPLRPKAALPKRPIDDGSVSMWIQKVSNSTPPVTPASSPPRTRYGPSGHVDPDRSSSSQPPTSYHRRAPSPSPISPAISGGTSASNHGGSFYHRSSLADSTRVSIGDASMRDSFTSNYDRPISMATTSTNVRQSVASTAITVVSSILDTRSRANSINYFNPNHSTGSTGGAHGNKFGTIRTIMTDLTSDGVPSIGKAEGMGIMEDMNARRRSSGTGSGYGVGELGQLSMNGKMRDRNDSETPTHDLGRVAEETEGSVSSKGRHGETKERGRERYAKDREKGKEREVERGGERERIRAPVDIPSPRSHLQSRSQSQTNYRYPSTHTSNQVPVPISAVNLRKGKWPDDFIDAFEGSRSGPWGLSAGNEDLDPDEWSVFDSTTSFNNNNISTSSSFHVPSSAPLPISVSPPRKLAIIGAPRRPSNPLIKSNLSSNPSDVVDLSNSPTTPSSSVPPTSHLAPRRPSHRARHSVDGPVLLPKETQLLRRDSSPDRLSSSPSGRVVLRRNSSSRTGVGDRRGIYVPKGYLDDRRNSGSGASITGIERENREEDSRVPFPRSVSGEYGGYVINPSPRVSVGDGNAVAGVTAGASASNVKIAEPPRMRGRFSSEIDGTSSRRKARPSSYDELGAKLTRSRIGSMVNLGGASANASASDLLHNRDSMDGSAYRKTLIVKEDGKTPTHFQLGNCIGRGQFGSVYRALNLNTGQMVAVKRIRLEGLKEEEITQLMKEVDLLKRLSHPSIVKYEGMVRDPDTLNIILEYAENGSLAHTIKAFGKLNERLVASYVIKILEGLDYLHESDVVHCDLKAANILTTKNGNVKLSDFGVSLNLRAMGKDAKDVAGTPNWMAPEVIELSGASTKSDIWSLACTVIELLTGRPPYADLPNSMSVMYRIVEDGGPPIPEECSELLEDFLKHCFQKDPNQRPSADALIEHPWLKQNSGIPTDLRPKDSIPWLHRISTDLQKDGVRNLFRDSFVENGSEAGSRAGEPLSAPPPGRRVSNASLSPLGDSEISPRDHTFIKTTFSKAMICRVCLTEVKKNAVLCEKCSYIAHSTCTPHAPPTCDFRAQLLRYANYAEQGNPSSLYVNPLDILNDVRPAAPGSDVPYVSHSTPRTSIDGSAPQNEHLHAPNAMKLINKAFKRSRSNLNHESTSQPSTPQSASHSSRPPPPPIEKDVSRKSSVVKATKTHHERPISLASISTSRDSSMRSAATAAESFSSSSRNQRSLLSNEVDLRSDLPADAGALEAPQPSRVTSTSGASEAVTIDDIPGGLQQDTTAKRSHKKKGESKSSGGCAIQ